MHIRPTNKSLLLGFLRTFRPYSTIFVAKIAFPEVLEYDSIAAEGIGATIDEHTGTQDAGFCGAVMPQHDEGVAPPPRFGGSLHVKVMSSWITPPGYP